MTNKEVYQIWAPFGKRWTEWVRPVPFINIQVNTIPNKPIQRADYKYIALMQEKPIDTSTAIIVDLPDSDSIPVGIELAKFGYRPIPIHNGTIETYGSHANVDNTSVSNDLAWGASILKDINIPDDAPPAFLTDLDRLQRRKFDLSVFDNSWDVYHQDLPSENYLLEHGIDKIIVVSPFGVASDLKSIFAEYDKKKISIFWTDGQHEPVLCKRAKKSTRHQDRDD